MKKQSLFAILCCICLCFLMGCGTARIGMNVESFINQDLNVADYNRFSFLPINTEKPLMEKQLFTFVRSEMEKKGYIYDDKEPQFLITVQMGVTSQEKQAGVHSRPIQVYQPPPVGSKDNKYGTWQTQHVTGGGGSYTVNTRWMKIDFIDVRNKKPDDKITYLWQGEVNNRGGSELSEVAKCLISGLLLDYPVKLQKSTRTIKFAECK
jgi:hypothetical protein